MENSVSLRYAQALFLQAEEANQVNEINNDMVLLEQFLKKSAEFQYLVTEPTIESSKRITILGNVIKTHVSQLMFVFLMFLEEKQRLDRLFSIAQSWNKIFLESRKKIRVKIVSAFTVTEDFQNTLIKTLTSKLKKEILLDVVVDSKLIGGFKLQVGDTVYDHSFLFQLEKFKKQYLLN